MLKQHEQTANLAVQQEQEEQAAQNFTPYWNFSMIDDEVVLQSREKFKKAIQTFLQKFSRYCFGVMPKVLLIAWERFSEIKHAFTDKQYQPEEIQELMCKLLEDEYLENSSNEIAPVLPTEEPEYSLNMGDKHLRTIPETEYVEVIKSSVKNLVQIPSEYEVTSDNESECDVPVCEDSYTFYVLKHHSEILSDSNNDDTLSDDDAFEDIEYVEASLELVSLEEENDVHQEEKKIDLEDILQIQDVVLHEKLLSINRFIADIKFLNDNPTPDHVLKYSSSFPIFEKSDNSLSYSDNSLPEFKTFSDHTKETRSGSTTSHANNSPPEYDSFCFKIEHDQEDNSIPQGIENFNYESKGDIHFLEELLSNDSLPFPENESSNFDHHDDPSFPRPPPEPPDVEFFFDFEPNSGELISAVINNIDELNEDECFDPGGGEIDVFANIEDDDYFPFIFVIRIFLLYLIYPEVSPLLLSTGSEDTIFDPGISTWSRWHFIGMEVLCALMFI
nr:hypothetical protein [Tanacetum cinerariifolium]